MQEEVENKTVVLIVNGTKLTGRLLKSAAEKYLAYQKERRRQKQAAALTPVIPHGKQTVTQLIGQGQGVSKVEITDPFIADFDRIARKYGVDYAVRKDRTCHPPKFLIFFKSQDDAALQAALSEYTAKITKALNRPSVIKRLRTLVQQMKNAVINRSRQKGQPVR